MNDLAQFLSLKLLQVCVFFIILASCDILFFGIDGFTKLYAAISGISYISHLFIELKFAKTENEN